MSISSRANGPELLEYLQDRDPTGTAIGQLPVHSITSKVGTPVSAGLRDESERTDTHAIRVVSIIEAQFVTGPAKPLLDFAWRARRACDDLPAVQQSVVTYHRGTASKIKDNHFVEAAERAGTPVEIIHEKCRFDRSVVPQIAAILDRIRPDIVETHNVKSHFLMRYSGLARKYPWVAFFHGHVTTDVKMRSYNQLDRWSLRAARHVITVCEPFRRALESRGIDPGRISVHHNSIQPFVPVDEAVTERVRRSLSYSRGTPLLLMVSRLSREKGHLDFLAALALLKRRGVRCHAVIVGEGPERGAIEGAIKRLELTGSVALAGHQNDVRPYLAAATVYLMPSHSEGSPLALLEAMVTGVPVIASGVGGIPEIITHASNGIITPPRNPAALAHAIERMIAEPGLAKNLAANALRDAARFSPESYRRALVGVYQRVLSRPGCGRALRTVWSSSTDKKPAVHFAASSPE